MSTPRTFLSRDELRELIGVSRKNLQIEWLESHGWKHEINWVGEPVVLRAYAERRLGLGKPSTSRSKLNLDALAKKAS